MTRILIVEDDLGFARILEVFLRKKGFTVDCATNKNEGEKLAKENKYQLFLLDYKLPDGTGLELLSNARRNGINIPTVVMTSFNEVRLAVKAMQSGAFDYITKPINPDELLMLIDQALNSKTDKESFTEKSLSSDFVKGDSESSKKLHEYIALVAPTDMSVIIEGESGTGKENVARSIHNLSKRQRKSFVAIDCGALSKDLAASELFGHVKGAFTGALQDKKGQFEMADGGTFFLDEVGNLSYEVQVKLLRAIQEKIIQPVGSHERISVDVRLITATNDSLLNSVRHDSFREDLYHRLNEFKIKVPALRDRGEDLYLFIEHFINEANTDLGKNVRKVSEETLDIFRKYDWPGNLRELRNVIRRMVLLSGSDTLTNDSLPEDMILSLDRKPKLIAENETDLKAIQEQNEKKLIVETLEKVKFNKSKAAKILNIDRKTLYNKLEKYNIDL